MDRCPKCNNELADSARFCNICGTPIQAASANNKRIIRPEIRHARSSRESQVNSISPASTPPPVPSSKESGVKPDASITSSPASWLIRPIAPAPTSHAPSSPGAAQPKPEQFRAPGIIRPIVTSPPRQNMPISTAQTPPNPVSPPPAIPITPALPKQYQAQSGIVKYPRQINTPAPASPAQNKQRQVEPSTSQDLPIFSPESFAHSSKAAEHWRNSWRDRQYAEAGPGDNASKGQASVPAPLATKQNSFIRMRAISKQQKLDEGEKNFGFWVTIFLMICLICGLGAFIIYTYLPNASSNSAQNSQGGAQQPSLSIVGTPSQTFSIGQSLRVHGTDFGANDSIHFLLDAATLKSSGQALTAQCDDRGAFDVTIVIGRDWSPGTHFIQAIDSRANLSAYLDIEVNPAANS